MRYIGLGRRGVAQLVDLLIMGGIIAAMGDYGDGPGYRVSWLGWRYVLAFLVVPTTYVVMSEWLLGATPGKLVMGIRVRDVEGGRIGFGQSLARNLARLIDAIPYVIPYLVGAVAVSRSPRRQRLGDRWADTVVIAWGSDAEGDAHAAHGIGSSPWPPLPPPPPSKPAW
jgi:uncharacterized RDD family membrane protein YckC